MNRDVVYALLAAMLFGVSTPLAKGLLGAGESPWLIAGLLYLGSGVGLCAIWLARERSWRATGLQARDGPWLVGAMVFGGILGPLALMVGLTHARGSEASLLLNLEAVLTALLAWWVFKENAGRRVVMGMLAIVAGGMTLAVRSGGGTSDRWGPVWVVVACLCWAIDNNLTRQVSTHNALFIAGSKGMVAGIVNTALALAWGASWPSMLTLIATMVLGLFGYGLSLVLFVLALRGLGAARTGAYFATAPFIGALLSTLLLGDPTPPTWWLACGLMALGVWLHLSERHEHEHAHEALEHEHFHWHDEHHQHDHDFAWDLRRPHRHAHQHEPMVHRHAHVPDIHHRHTH